MLILTQIHTVLDRMLGNSISNVQMTDARIRSLVLQQLYYVQQNVKLCWVKVASYKLQILTVQRSRCTMSHWHYKIPLLVQIPNSAFVLCYSSESALSIFVHVLHVVWKSSVVNICIST